MRDVDCCRSKVREMGGLSLLLSLLLLLLALAGLGAALGLEILVVDGQSLVDLGTQSAVILKPAM